MTLPAGLYSNTNTQTNSRWAIHEELQELGVSPHQLNKYLVLCVRLLKSLFLNLAFDLPISLWSVLFNSLSNLTSLWSLFSLSYPIIFVHSNCLRSLTHVYAVSNRVSFCENLKLRTLIITHPSRLAIFILYGTYLTYWWRYSQFDIHQNYWSPIHHD